MKSNKKYRRYGTLLYFVLKIISKTLRVKIIKSNKIDPEENYVYASWHNNLVIGSLCFLDIGKTAVLASPSKDGELISVSLEKMGFEVVRGSSDKESVKSLIKLIGLVRKGYNAGTPVDGPKGPIYKVKAGMLYIAQKSGKQLLPVGGAFEKAWIFEKAWDKFKFPKPFTRMICLVGDPIDIPKGADLEEYALILEKELNRLDREAEKMLKK